MALLCLETAKAEMARKLDLAHSGFVWHSFSEVLATAQYPIIWSSLPSVFTIYCKGINLKISCSPLLTDIELSVRKELSPQLQNQPLETFYWESYFLFPAEAISTNHWDHSSLGCQKEQEHTNNFTKKKKIKIK